MRLSHPPSRQSDDDSPDDAGDGAGSDGAGFAADWDGEGALLGSVCGDGAVAEVAVVVAASVADGAAAPGQSPVGLVSGRAGPGPPSRPKS